MWMCGGCAVVVRREQTSIECSACRQWWHEGCSNVNVAEYTGNREWICRSCPGEGQDIGSRLRRNRTQGVQPQASSRVKSLIGNKTPRKKKGKQDGRMGPSRDNEGESGHGLSPSPSPSPRSSPGQIQPGIEEEGRQEEGEEDENTRHGEERIEDAPGTNYQAPSSQDISEFVRRERVEVERGGDRR